MIPMPHILISMRARLKVKISTDMWTLWMKDILRLEANTISSTEVAMRESKENDERFFRLLNSDEGLRVLPDRKDSPPPPDLSWLLRVFCSLDDAPSGSAPFESTDNELAEWAKKFTESVNSTPCYLIWGEQGVRWRRVEILDEFAIGRIWKNIGYRDLFLFNPKLSSAVFLLEEPDCYEVHTFKTAGWG